MFKKLSIEFNPIHDVKDKDVERLQGELTSIFEKLQDVQTGMFTTSMPVSTTNVSPLEDHLLFMTREDTGVSSNPDYMFNPTAVGFGRQYGFKNNRIEVSTLFHASDKISIGDYYGVDGSGLIIPVEPSDTHVLIVPVAEGLGYILWEAVMDYVESTVKGVAQGSG